MNCLEFRRMATTSPHELGGLGEVHQQDCPSCHAYVHEQLALDDQLMALFEVPVPDDLSSRILMHQAFNDEAEDQTGLVFELSKRLKPMMSKIAAAGGAMAATLIIAVTIIPGVNTAQAEVQRHVIGHMQHETKALMMDLQVPQEDISRLMRRVNMQASERWQQPNFAALCRFEGKISAHFVYEYNGQKVTVFVMPEENEGAFHRFQVEQWHGEIIPIGMGSMALMSDSEEALDQVIRRLTNGNA